MMDSIIGIDAGKSGGFAWKIGEVIGSQKMPDTDRDVIELIDELIEMSDSQEIPAPRVYLEQVGGYIGVPQPASSMFNFGRGYGFLIGVVMSKNLSLSLIRPQMWQKIIGTGKKGERSTTQWKNHLKDIAQKLYPNQKITLSTSDAFLILETGIARERDVTGVE